MRRQPILAATLVLLLPAFQSGCQPPKAKEAAAKPPAPAKVEKMPGEADLTTITLTPEAEIRLRLKTEPIEAKEVVRTRVVGGEVVIPPGRALIVSAPLPGTLYAPPEGIPSPGTVVKKGQVIFNLVPLLSAEAQTTFATTRVEATGQIEQAEKQLAQAKLVLERAERLRQQNLGGAGAVEDAKSGFEVAQATLKAATTRRDAIDQAIKGAEGGNVASIPIAAEGGGVLRNLHVAPGQKVASGTILFDVVNLDPVHIRVPLYVGDLSKIDGTRPAEVGDLSDSPGMVTRPAKRVADPPSGDPIAATVDLFYEVSNKDGSLRPGQRVGVSLPLKGTKSGLVVPRASLLRDVDGGTWVYEALDKHKSARRRVRVDNVVGEVASLSAGPKAGVKVVTDGAAELFGVEFGGGK
jgi:cobalt-zinc-cadmium efflux system membrane fusion protein